MVSGLQPVDRGPQPSFCEPRPVCPRATAGVPWATARMPWATARVPWATARVPRATAHVPWATSPCAMGHNPRAAGHSRLCHGPRAACCGPHPVGLSSRLEIGLDTRPADGQLFFQLERMVLIRPSSGAKPGVAVWDLGFGRPTGCRWSESWRLHPLRESSDTPPAAGSRVRAHGEHQPGKDDVLSFSSGRLGRLPRARRLLRLFQPFAANGEESSCSRIRSSTRE